MGLDSVHVGFVISTVIRTYGCLKRELIETVLQVVKVLVDVTNGIHYLHKTVVFLACWPCDAAVGLALPATIGGEAWILQ